MFDFADDEIYLSNKFWVYWAFAIPLTITVVTIWLIWTNAKRKRVKNRNRKLQGGDEESGLIQATESACRWRIWRRAQNQLKIEKSE